MSLEWFARFADIPGVQYSGAEVDRRRLPGYDAVPRVESFTFNGQVNHSLWWSERDGGGSASPAQKHGRADLKGTATAEALRILAETLELPGKPSDYHFAIQNTAYELWGRRREEPEVLETVERLCWLDIGLVEAWPAGVTNESCDDSGFFEVRAFWVLITMYEREGALREAIDVAERAARFDQQQDSRLVELRERLAVLEAETGS